VLKELWILPGKNNHEEERFVLELNEFEVGYPRLSLSQMIDIASFILNSLAHSEYVPYNAEFRSDEAKRFIQQRVGAVQTNNEISWKALLGKLRRLRRMDIFDNPRADPLHIDQMIAPGRTIIVDMSDADSTVIDNLVISNILRNIQQAQEKAYERATQENQPTTPVMIFLEEAHEFLSR